MEKNEYMDDLEKKENKTKKVSELLKINNFSDKKTIPHSIILSNIEETVEFYNNIENMDKNSTIKK